ncbi:hypothetical protein [Bdellovibrio bacteriovorus]|uniref:hypothetical protein n=1 Tax=Bdellovibrio bacteriovorus TaxID=959 RepID=UPI003AA830AC
MKTCLYLISVLFFVAVSTISCSEEPKELIPTDLPSTETPPTGEGAVGVAPAGTALYFRLGLQWESATDPTVFADWPTVTSLGGDKCNISVASPLAQRTINCAFTIPEAQLYYSHLQFKMGTTVASSCPILKFRPYSYMRSNMGLVAADPTATPPVAGQPGYTAPDTETAISCSTGKDGICYGGAAPTMVPDFPLNDHLYFMTHIGPESAYTLNSENSLRYYGSDGARVNYLTTNNLDAAGRAMSVSSSLMRNERVANTFVDYRVSCINYWGETLYEINLFIADENYDDSGGVDHYIDWN